MKDRSLADIHQFCGSGLQPVLPAITDSRSAAGNRVVGRDPAGYQHRHHNHRDRRIRGSRPRSSVPRNSTPSTQAALPNGVGGIPRFEMVDSKALTTMGL